MILVILVIVVIVVIVVIDQLTPKAFANSAQGWSDATTLGSSK